MNPLVVPLLLAATLILLGGVSAWVQLRGRRQLRERTHVPSDEHAYLRGRYRRRLLASALMLLAGGMIAGAYLSGMEAQTDNVAAGRNADGGDKPADLGRNWNLVHVWAVYWALVILLAFLLIVVAIVDGWASRRYWLGVYRALKEDHDVRLRRDIAVYKQQKDDRGAHRGKL